MMRCAAARSAIHAHLAAVVGRRRFALIAMALLASSLLNSTVLADGGVVVASGELSGRRVTLFIAPAAPRAGIVEVSVLRSPAPGAATPILIVAVHARTGTERSAVASPTTGGNRLLESALLELPFDGAWHMEVRGGDGWPSPSFTIEVAPALPPWRSQWPWLFAWVPLTTLLLVRDRLARSR